MKNKFNTSILHSYEKKSSSTGVHPPIDLSLTFHYPDAQGLVDAFQGRKAGFTYSRSANPTTAELEKKINVMEEGVGTLCFGTGMAALATACFAFLKKGDHVLVSWFLFGNTYNFFKTLARLGIEVTFVDVTKIDEVRKELKKNTKLFFAETIANPNTQIPDWENLSNLLNSKKIVTLIDNTLTSPFLFSPKKLGFSISFNSLSKYIAGHSSALGGSLSDLGNYSWEDEDNILSMYKKKREQSLFITQVKKKGIRDMGGILSPQAAHIISLGSETLTLRMQKQCENALVLANYLREHPAVEYIHYPGLRSHPQHHIAKKYYRYFGALFSFKIKGDPLDFCNQFQLILRASHLGDNRTLSIPVAQTIFHEASLTEKKTMGIDENLIRLSIGIEDPDDLLADLAGALKHIK